VFPSLDAAPGVQALVRKFTVSSIASSLLDTLKTQGIHDSTTVVIDFKYIFLYM
jgi:hypothetical protein